MQHVVYSILSMNCTVITKWSFVTCGHLTCCDLSKVITVAAYTKAHRQSKFFQRCEFVELEYNIVD
jgi:hypothetical protein